MALKRACHDLRIHTKLAPEGKQARAVYDAVEQARVEAIGARAMKGVADNIGSMLEDKFAKANLADVRDKADAPIEEARGADGAREADRPRCAEERRARRQSLARVGRGEGRRRPRRPARQARRPAGLRPRRARHAGLDGNGRGARRRPAERRDRGRATTQPQGEEKQRRGRRGRFRRRPVAVGGRRSFGRRRAGRRDGSVRRHRRRRFRRRRRRRRDARRGQAPRQSASTNLPRDIDYKVFTTAFDETVGAEELCDEEELDRLRAFLDKQLPTCRAWSGGSPTGCSAA